MDRLPSNGVSTHDIAKFAKSHYGVDIPDTRPSSLSSESTHNQSQTIKRVPSIGFLRGELSKKQYSLSNMKELKPTFEQQVKSGAPGAVSRLRKSI